MRSVTPGILVLLGTAAVVRAAPARAQAEPTAPRDSAAHRLPPITVTATRSDVPLAKVPHAVQVLERAEISRARPTWGLDEALLGVPGVYVANRYNFSLDQRVAIRGFGARSAFAMRGVKVLLDGIPQTLPDGQGQLTNLELGLVDRMEVLRGASSALFGNASGGVISLWTDPTPGDGKRREYEVRLVGGAFDRDLERTWTKWQGAARFRAAGGAALVAVSRLAYEGERDHSNADLRNLNLRYQRPLARGWELSLTLDAGDQPRADNPGALTAQELRANRDSAAAANLLSRAGKAVRQLQTGVMLRRAEPGGGEAAVTLFALTRDLDNPLPFAYIRLDRRAYGARVTVTHPLRGAHLPRRVTFGLDFQRQRDDRVNHPNDGGRPDTSTRTLDQLEQVSELGPFVQVGLALSPVAAVTAGARYDRVSFRVRDRLVTGSNPDDSGERVMEAVSGSLGVTVEPGDRVVLYASAASSFETPTTTELANRPDTAGGFNAALEPQRAWNYELGARSAGGGLLTWNAALFRVDVENLLVSFEIPSSPQRRFFRNAGRARHVGLEIGGSLVPGEAVVVRGSWTWSRFRYVDYAVPAAGGGLLVRDGSRVPGIPEHFGRLLVRVGPAAARGAWIEVEQTASTGYPVDDTAAVRVSGWSVTTLRAGWDGRLGDLGLHPFLAVANVFDRHYVGSVVVNAARGRYYEPAPGRHLYLGVSLGAGW
ncbi:MAG TPA: TonB-dependent receptor [Gemmatimonadales bacterium]|nr:TonB-dependent receptor [Gemmatimonadales bacterium]